MKNFLLKTWLIVVCLLTGAGTMWAESTVTTYTFNSKSWGATCNGSAANWTGSKDGNQYSASQSPIGVQILAAGNGTTVTSPKSFTNVSKVVVNYSSSSKGVGSIKVSVGGTDIDTKSISKSQSKVDLTYTPTTNLSGNVVITCNCTTNSYALVSVSITEETGGTTPETPTVAAPIFDVAAGTYTEDKLVLIDNYNSDYLYAYTIDGTDPAFDENLDVTNGTAYDNDEGIEITSSCTLKAIAVDEDGNASSITSAAYVINKPQVFASLEELVAADLASETTVTVSFENIAIKDIFVTQQGYRNGVYFDIQKGGKDIEIYYQNVPEEWIVGGTLSGTMTCPWKLYSGTWELAPEKDTWAWANLTYKAPAQKTITALAVSGTPTKTAYNVGDAFETAGLVVTATYSDNTTAPITTGFEWEIDYGEGNDALVAGATSVDVMAYTEDVMSEVYTVNGLTVTVPVTLTSIAVSGTPTKTSYYVGEAFETAGLVVTGHYSDGSDKNITDGIEWTVDPETLTLGTTTVDVIAGVGSVVSEVYTVEGIIVTENPYKTATISSFSATSGDINTDIAFEAFKGNASTAPAVNSNNLRLYQNGGYVTVTAATGLKIASVKITTSATYASTTVGYCVDDEDAPTTGETVAKSSNYTISNLDNKSVSIYCLGTDKDSRLEISAIEVKYSGNVVAELKNIELSGTYPKEFTKGGEFSHEGMTVTANYTDGSDKDVTSDATFSGYDMNTLGEQTVTVSYTEGEITETAEYTITVNKAPFVPTPVAEGYETVDFTALEPYKSLQNNGSADMATYEGISFSAEFAKKSGTNNAPKFYQNGNAVRCYVDNTITINGAEPIQYVGINWTVEDDAVSITGLGTTTAVVTFSKTCRFTAITVDYRTYKRTITEGDYGTLCLPYAVAAEDLEGAVVYNIAGTTEKGIVIEQLDENAELEAGHAYIFKATSDELVAKGHGEAAKSLAQSYGLVGNFGPEKMDVPQDCYVISGKQIRKVTTGKATIGQYRAYIDLSDVSVYDASSGKRAVVFGFDGSINEGGVITGVDSIENTTNEDIYDLQGRRVVNAHKGMYIVNGKKVIR